MCVCVCVCVCVLHVLNFLYVHTYVYGIACTVLHIFKCVYCISHFVGKGYHKWGNVCDEDY